MTLQIIILTIFAVATSVLFSIVRLTHGGIYSLMRRTLASFAFVCLGVVVVFQYPQQAGLFLILALVCGMIGDILLDLKSVDSTRANAYTNFGMLTFGVGHTLSLR